MASLIEYRKAKKSGVLDDMINNKDVNNRVSKLYSSVKQIRYILEKNITDTYSAEGLFEIFKKGVFAVPHLWEGREEFKDAVKWKTGIFDGGMHVLQEDGFPLDPVKRIKNIFNE